jgi:NAD(P)-dependent dehydrogenase (short-subunit alcohol dehydrogenase family)
MADFSFKNKVIVITGAGVGIGFEIAKQLAATGAKIVLNDIDQIVAEKAVEEIKSEDGDCFAVIGDSGELKIIKKMITTAVEKFGRLDFAIANAGITTFGNFLDYTEDNFQKVLQVNLKGTFFLAQQAALQMVKQGDGGRIILMSSVTGFTYHPDLTAYGMSKSAIAFLAKNLGVELGKYQITVNAIAPGAIITERTLALEDGKYEETWERITPNNKCGTTKDIANTAMFLLSDGAGHITSQTIIVDGGWTSTSPPPE